MAAVEKAPIKVPSGQAPHETWGAMGSMGSMGAPNPNNAMPLPKKEVAPVPVGKRVPGKANYVYSPFASSNQVVDIEGHSPGTKVKCPYTGKVFAVPGN